MGGRSGRVILLRDGTEVSVDDDSEMFDHEEEDKDLESQASKSQPNVEDAGRGAREETSEPEAAESSQLQQSLGSSGSNPRDAPLPITTEHSVSGDATQAQAIPESALPDKIVASPSTEEKQ